MNNAIKLGKLSTILSSKNTAYLACATKSYKSVRFVHVNSATDPKHPHFTNMDAKKAEQKDKKLDVMEESFGGGYSTRSDEEGFGGVYGGNDEDNAEMKIVQDPAHHDSTQGSEVKEKEAARNQTKAA
ncbi:hypothetical protein RND81_02G139100 [Saponaria officinalis]|uniref:Uncharacterized protein n=1 Tax=Saponaria officinalis TaxID=3572 RepID=A0AAW1MM03_SAPOF